jgi:hypothetical protein
MKSFLPFLLFCTCAASSLAAPALREVGAASVDITPDYPVRLSGYGSRREPHVGVALPIHAKALAIGSDAEGPAVLLTVDNCGVPATMRDEVLRRLTAKSCRRTSRISCRRGASATISRWSSCPAKSWSISSCG